MAALSQEVQPFLRQVGARRLRGSSVAGWKFAFKGKEGLVAVSGMGAEAAGQAASLLFRDFQPEILISLGFGGAVTPAVPAGALVLGEAYWRFDPDPGELVKVTPPFFPAAPGYLAEKLKAQGLPALVGNIVSTPVIIPKAVQGGPLRHLAGPVLDLETAVLAQAARERNLPFLGLRAVTDAAEEEIPAFLCQAAREGHPPTLGGALFWLLADIRRLPVLLRLWRRSHLAARRLSQALTVVLAEL
ncbi:MAG: phosphorylase family protein [Desulfobaccales bacterium]